MALPQSIRQLIPLVIGLAVGGVGAVLFQQSLTGGEGTPEQRVAKLEVELKKAQNRIAALGDTDPRGRRKSGRTMKDNLQEIRDKIHDGQAVTPDDFLRLMQPWMRDISPLMERMRVREQNRMIDQKSGEFARKYDLTPNQQTALRRWFETKTEENAKEWTNLVTQEGTRFQDLIKAAQDVRADDGLDQFMATTLSGDKLTKFQTERLAEKAERVQQDADTRTQRLDSIVKLDDAQRDQVFGIMARSSRDYDPALKLEGGVGEIGAAPGGNKQQAVLSILRPEQRTAFQEEMKHRREQAQKDIEAIGLSLPEDWDPMEMEDF
jgi:hypothetical protein